jgi:peptide deformylase
MKKYNLVVYPDGVLRKKAKEVLKIDDEVKNLVEQMLDIMYANNGIGLAAPQVGVLLQVVVIDLQEDDKKNPMVVINPKILNKSKELSELKEGCLSLPEIRGLVLRPAEITVEFLDLEGKKHLLHADDLLATCFQHEIDHLNGRLFIDYLPVQEKNSLLRVYKKQQEESKTNEQN